MHGCNYTLYLLNRGLLLATVTFDNEGPQFSVLKFNGTIRTHMFCSHHWEPRGGFDSGSYCLNCRKISARECTPHSGLSPDGLLPKSAAVATSLLEARPTKYTAIGLRLLSLLSSSTRW